MGGLMSTKDYAQYHDYDELALQLQTHFEEHRHDLTTITKTMNAHKTMMLLLDKLNANTCHTSGDYSEHVNNDAYTSLKDLLDIQLMQLMSTVNSFENIKRSLAFAIDALIGKRTSSLAFVNLKKELQSDKSTQARNTQDVATSNSPDDSPGHTLHSPEEIHAIKNDISVIKEWCAQARPEHQASLVHEKNQHITRLEHDIVHEKQTNDKLKLENSKLSGRLYECQHYIDQMKRRENEQMYRRPEAKKRYERRQCVNIQLYHQRNDDSMKIIVDGIDNIIKQHLNLFGFDATIEHCNAADKLRVNVPVLVLCIYASRLGTDCTAAMTGLTKQHQAALLIFHHKDSHATSIQKSSRQLTGPEFKDIVGMYDLVFTKAKGIYDCDINTDAINSIIPFITSTCST
ncbi:hypothetical protein ACF0H5_002352 [Mactra antiquata]